MQTLSFSGSTEKTFRIYSLASLQSITGQCDARVESLSFSLDESTWAASSASAFMDSSSDLDCRDGSITLVIDPAQFNFGSNLAEGESSTRTIWIRGTTPWGTAASAKIHVTYVKDTLPPSVGSLATSKGLDLNIADGSVADITGTCTTGDSAVSVSARDGNGGVASATAIPCVGGRFIAAGFSFSSLRDGTITITVTQTDEAGNPPATASISIAKDLVAPALTITTPNADGVQVTDENRSAFTISGACTNGDPDILLKYDGASVETIPCGPSGGWNVTLDLRGKPAGNATIIAIQTDALGNSTTVSRQVLVTLSLPTLTINSLAATVISSSTTNVTISGTCSEAGQNVVLTAPSNVSGSGACSGGGTYSFTANFSSIADTNSPIPVTVSHTKVGAGTQTASTTILKKDTVVPTPPTSVTLAKSAHNSLNTTPAITYTGQTDATSGVKNVYGRIVRASDNAVIEGFTLLSASPAVLSSSTLFVEGTTYRVEIKVDDNVGNTSAISASQPTWKFDGLAPALTFSGRTNGDRIGAPDITPNLNLTGTCETGLSVTVSGRGVPANTTVSCASGSWFYSIPSASMGADGLIVYVVQQTDAAGNTGSASLNLTLDLTPPVVALNTPASFINSLNSGSYSVYGTCDGTALPTIGISQGGTHLGNAACSTGGTFSVALNLTSLGEGANTLKAEQYDSAGNSGFDQKTFMKDTVAPTAPSSITLGAGYTNDTAQSPAMNYSTISDSNGVAQVQYQILDTTNSNTALSGWATAPASGGKVSGAFVNGHTYRLLLRALDVPGNTSAAFGQQPTWTVDTIPPVIQITNYADEGRIGIPDIVNGLTISGTCEPNLSVEFWGTNFNSTGAPGKTTCSSDGTFSYLVPSNAFSLEQRYTFYAREIDLTEVNSSTVSVDLDLDKTAPVVAFDTPSISSYIGATDFDVGGTCTTGDLSVEIKLDGVSQGTVICSSGRFAISIKASTLSEGLHNFQASQSDSSGNSGSVTLALTKDTVAPTMGFKDLVKHFTSSTTASAQLTYDYPDDGAEGSGLKHVETLIKDSSNQVVVGWGVHANLQSRPGTFVDGAEYSVEARYVDNANNVSASVSVGNFRVDTVAPIIDFVFVDHETADVTLRTTPIVQAQWSDVGSGVNRLVYSIKNRRTGAAIATNQGITTNLSLFAAGRTLGPFGSATPFNLTDSFEITIKVEDQAGNQSDPSIATWEACPPQPFNFNRTGSEHPSVVGSDSVTIPPRCAGKAVVITAIGEAGRKGDGTYISEKGIGSGAVAAGVFSGESLAGKTLSIKFGGAGPAGHGSLSNSSRWGGRYAAVVGVKSDGSRIAVIAGGGGGLGADMRSLPSGKSAVNLPGLGGDRGTGLGSCNPAGTGNDRTICGKNGNPRGVQGTDDPSGLWTDGGTKGIDVGVCAGFLAASDGTGASLDLKNSEGIGGRGLNDGDITKVGGGGGGGFGGGGGGGSYQEFTQCYGGSGGGGGSIVYGNISGTVEAIAAGVNQGSPEIFVTYGATLPSTQCQPNFIYIPRLRGPDGFYNVNEEDINYVQNGFCISKYEISGTLASPQSAPFSEPITNMTKAEAELACSKFGDDYKLASNEQWQSVAQIAHWNHLNWKTGDIGTTEMNVGLVSDSRDGSAGFAAGDEDVNACVGTTSQGSCPVKSIWSLARRTHILGVAVNAPSIWDMSGSMKELVRGENTYGGGVAVPQAPVSTLMGVNSLQGAFGYYFPTARYNYGSHGSANLGLGQINLTADTSSIFTRGSSYLHTKSQAGLFSIVSTNPAGESNRGFRCVKESAW